MAPGRSPEMELRLHDPILQERLLTLAALGVRHAAEARTEPAIDPAGESPALLQPGASFVTLKRDGRLRGCIGSLEPTRPLAQDVAANAYAAARRDPRFPVLEVHELDSLEVSVATLGRQQGLVVESRSDLIVTLRPGIDGLVVRSGAHRATFLPAVWEQLPDPESFVAALWRKAGLPPNAWPRELQLSRYHVEHFETRL
jgi:AmmeMemoRadiSam system protein A